MKDKKYSGKVDMIVAAILPEAIKIDGDGNRCGYLCIADSFGVIRVLSPIGQLNNSDYARNLSDSLQVEVYQLFKKPSCISTCSITGNKEQQNNIRCVRDKAGNIYGVCGFSPDVNEAFATAVAFALCNSEMPEERQGAIAAISGNLDIEYLCSVGDVLPATFS